MYWYNPTNPTSERVAAPRNDAQAVRMLARHPASAAFVSEYAGLRRSGAPLGCAARTGSGLRGPRGEAERARARPGAAGVARASEEVEAERRRVRAPDGGPPQG